MFSYMGAKYRLAPKYGSPSYPVVIEPFAGSACYSLYWSVERAILYDLNPIIAGMWQYLIRASESEILSLPVDFDTVDDLTVCQEAKWLIGFWLAKGRQAPGKTPSAWYREYRPKGYKAFWGQEIRFRVSRQVSQIRRWESHCLDYKSIQNIEATWFIDPPYEVAGKHYPFSDLDFGELAEFCRTRKGTTIVCENHGATWLPFQPFADARAMEGKGRTGISKEVVWYGTENIPSSATDYLSAL